MHHEEIRTSCQAVIGFPEGGYSIFEWPNRQPYTVVISESRSVPGGAIEAACSKTSAGSVEPLRGMRSLLDLSSLKITAWSFDPQGRSLF
jgi:hypothetical protein